VSTSSRRQIGGVHLVELTDFHLVKSACSMGNIDSIQLRLFTMALQVVAAARHNGPAEECHAGSIR
jgi:hypothetical protein